MRIFALKTKKLGLMAGIFLCRFCYNAVRVGILVQNGKKEKRLKFGIGKSDLDLAGEGKSPFGLYSLQSFLVFWCENIVPHKGNEMNKVFTTTEIAKILQVSNRKVTQWIDKETIKGFRLPGSTHRRVMGSELVNFMKANNYPLELLDNLSAENAIIEKVETSVAVN